jgi:carboxylesterase type B
MAHLSALLLYFSVTLAAALNSSDPGQYPTATIDSGVVIGTTTVLPSATSTVHKYYGVPFASPPERFQLSESPQPWESPFNATTNLNHACYQNYIYSADTAANLLELVIGDAPAPLETEDCLTLDVFAPAPPAANETKKAVLFWIYGGSYRTGSNNNPNYDGSSFAANQDVILVSPNYRLNIHGFPGNPQLEAPDQNLG